MGLLGLNGGDEGMDGLLLIILMFFLRYLNVSCRFEACLNNQSQCNLRIGRVCSFGSRVHDLLLDAERLTSLEAGLCEKP